jgi:hypothetical protein
MTKPNNARRIAEAPMVFIKIRVQTSPAIKLPSVPNTAARNPRSKANAMKLQTGAANKTIKNVGQIGCAGGGEAAPSGRSCGNPFPQNGQDATA